MTYLFDGKIPAAFGLPAEPITCSFCETRPAVNVPGCDFDICELCYEAITAPWPDTDEAWGEYLEDLVHRLKE